MLTIFRTFQLLWNGTRTDDILCMQWVGILLS